MSELVLLLQTEFNYLYRLYDGVPTRRSTHCASRAMHALSASALRFPLAC